MKHQHIALSLSSNNPNDPRHIVRPGMGYDGVVLLELPNGGICTGSLLWSGKHVLTAAHCLQNNNILANSFLVEPDAARVTVVFRLTIGTVRLEVEEIFIHPQWNNSENGDNDLAIIELKDVAPATAERYSIYRRSDEVGQIFTRVGYGVGGTGTEGERSGDRPVRKRFGGNRYDALKEGLVSPQLQTGNNIGKQLVYDFDSGLRRHDALGKEYSLHDLGLIGYDLETRTGVLGIGIIGNDGEENESQLLGNSLSEIGRHYEAASTSGDSGSPAFIAGKIAGIASNGRRSTLPQVDVTSNQDSSYGEIFFDTRVSAYADFIDEIVNPANDEIFLLQASFGVILLGLVVSAIAAQIFRR